MSIIPQHPTSYEGPDSTESALYDLASQYTFTALTMAQQAFVLSHLSEAEYAQMHALAVGSTEAMQASYPPTPGPAVRPALLAAVRRRKASVTGHVAAMLLHPLPAYQAGLAFVVVLISMLWLWPARQTQPDPATKTNIQIVRQRVVDTLYLVRATTGLPTSQHRPRHANRQPSATITTMSHPNKQPARELSLEVASIGHIALTTSTFSSRSLHDDSALTKFLIPVN